MIKQINVFLSQKYLRQNQDGSAEISCNSSNLPAEAEFALKTSGITGIK